MDFNEAPSRFRMRTILVLAGFAVLFMFLDSQGNLDAAFSWLQQPLAAVVGVTTEQADIYTDQLTIPQDLRTAQQEVVNLQAQVDAMRQELERLQVLEGEYDLLLEMFNRVEAAPNFERTIANVLAYSSSPFFQSVVIDKGAIDGIIPGMPVESARGLVGQIYRVTPNASQVILISDVSSSLPARLANSRATGVVRGGGLGNEIRLDWIDLEVQMEVGEIVRTSGLGGRFPSDIVLGEVAEIERFEAELFQSAIIRPAVDFDGLEAVFVITSFEPIDIEIFDTPPQGADN